MATDSISPNLPKIKSKIKTAIVYSIEYLFAYIVEIKDADKNYYICDENKDPVIFENLEDARKAAVKERVKEAYLALGKTDEENDVSATRKKSVRYDYSPLPLETKE